jgi:hypothetical protein
VEEYDPTIDTWTRKADMPTPRLFLTSVAVDGRIYAIGGVSNTNETLPLVEVYDPTTNTWTEGPPLAIAREELSACAVDGTIYVIGGFHRDNPVALGTVEALDLNPVVDFDSDGAVDIDDLLILIESWGLRSSLVDIGPMPWGDGIVDSKDLLVLAEHMVEYDNLVSDLQASFGIQSHSLGNP